MALQNVIDAAHAERVLADWWRRLEPDATGVSVRDVNVPKSSGLSSETVLFTVAWDGGERELVARVTPPGAGVFPEYDLERERQAMDAVRTTTSAPAPRVLAIETDPALLGAPFLVMERHYGRVAADDPPFTTDGWFVELTPEQQEQHVMNAVATLAELHRADVSGLGPAFVGHPDRGGDPVSQRLQLLRDYDAWVRGDRPPHPTIVAGFEWLESNRPGDSGPPGIVWGDARLGNLLFGADGTVNAVLDWDMTAMGPPEFDLAWFTFLNRTLTEGLGIAPPPGLPSTAAVVARYEELSGHTVRDFEFYEMFIGTYAAAILMRIALMMIDLGLIPEDSPMPIANPTSHVLSVLLGLPSQSASGEGWITGKR